MAVSLSAARLRLYHLLFDQTRRSGRRFEGLCGLFALLSVVIIFVESGLGSQYHLSLDEWHVFVWLEFGITAVFTAEYIITRNKLAESAALYSSASGDLSIWRPFFRCM